ncbi:MAG TPA: 3-hydroxyacyl-CoA dehydrogenase family protein [Planctomycetaceae bacterium]|nr:3-hydroxyacyl-CoA dehydrogenase family protein [Planctomycetaceae bacterium]
MEIHTVGVAGLGHLGRGIAACLLAHGFRVIGHARRPETRAAAREHIGRAVSELIQHGAAPQELASQWPGRYEEAEGLEALAPCQFVVESVAEDPAVKEEVFQAIEGAVGADVPLASNTSSIPISLLQRGRRHPERLAGMHWAEPAHVTRFLEVICGEATSEETIRRTMALGRRLGKEPALVRKDVPGFIVNRLGYALYREALHLVESGVADMETIDRACRNALGLWATYCGPFRWIDLTGGPALYGRAQKRVWPTLSSAAEIPEMLEKLIAADARGTANGRGFYQYTEAEAKRWEEGYRQHAWAVCRMLDRYYPLDEP